MNIIEEKWPDILEHLMVNNDFPSVLYPTWLEPLKIHKVEDHVVTIMIPADKSKAADYIVKKFQSPFYVAIMELTGMDYDIRFVKEEDITKENPQPVSVSMTQDDASFKAVLEKSNINPKYTFDTFVVGNNNKFAHAAALAVADTPGNVYNPLFLHGGVGLGKTHLMHSIANYILKERPQMKVLYVTSEYFTNELIETLRAGDRYGMAQFREKYRNIDVLLIDDVQFLIGKESTQEEFFHTFNTLHNANKQIIISSDRPPKEIETLEERLRTRFECGLIADIGSPDFETRMAIIRKKEETEGHHIDDEIVTYIASNIKSNIRELEGAYNRLIALSTLEKRPIDMELAQEAIKDIISPHQQKEITPDLIMNVICEHFQISSSDIKGSNRSAEFVYPRQIFMYLCFEMLGLSYKNIGDILGGRDHSTIISGKKKIANEMAESEYARQLIDTLKKKINPS